LRHNGSVAHAGLTTDIVLLGAGHAHVEVLRRHALRPMPGVRMTLIAREPHTPYSGMLPGLIRGDYSFGHAHIDCARLAAAAGARMMLAAADGIDLAAGRVLVGDRPSIGYDLLSIDVGGVPVMPAGGGIAVKPIGRFLDRFAAVETHLGSNARIAVIGGGVGGTELALALAVRLRGRARIVLVSRDRLPLAGAPGRARRIALAQLAAMGVELRGDVAALGHADGHLHLSNGDAVPADAALWATGVAAPGFLAQSELACDASGCVRLGLTLRSVSNACVFAAGDCAAVEGAARPKSGVWAVRAGRPLAANLRRAAAGQTLREWRPQRDALVILGLGDGRAVAWRNGITVAGRLAWWWKDRIDRCWMRKYHRLTNTQEDPPCAATGSPPFPPTA
jgi:selenide, water dikinase